MQNSKKSNHILLYTYSRSRGYKSSLKSFKKQFHNLFARGVSMLSICNDSPTDFLPILCEKRMKYFTQNFLILRIYRLIL